jgi:hypothetical protein
MSWVTRHRRAVARSAWLLGAVLLIWCWASVYYRSYMDRVHGGIAAHREGGRAGVEAFFHQYEAADHTWHYARAVVEEFPHAGYMINTTLVRAAWSDRSARPMNLGFLVAAVGYLLLLPLGLAVWRWRRSAGGRPEPGAAADRGPGSES